MLDEELLAAWLRLTTVIDNQRLAVSCAADQPRLPFNEAMVCGLLYAAQASGESLTASGLCRRTHILKSQMNAILRSLERQGLIERRGSGTDRRRVELRLRPAGLAHYRETHRRIRELVDRLVAEMGEERVAVLLPLLRQAADIFDAMEVA